MGNCLYTDYYREIQKEYVMPQILWLKKLLAIILSLERCFKNSSFWSLLKEMGCGGGWGWNSKTWEAVEDDTKQGNFWLVPSWASINSLISSKSCSRYLSFGKVWRIFKFSAHMVFKGNSFGGWGDVSDPFTLTSSKCVFTLPIWCLSGLVKSSFY